MTKQTVRHINLERVNSFLLWSLVWLLAAGVGGSSALAQADFEKGYQSYQSYHGSDFDTVNLANGNLLLNIPLISYEQRGGLAPVVISIRSNSTTFQPKPPYENGPQDTKQFEVASGVVGAPWGQPHVSISPGGLIWREERITTASKKAAGPEYLTRFVAIDESGATHSLGGAIANKAAGSVPGIMYSVDGSGLMLQPGTSQTGPVLIDRNGSAGGLVDTNGNAIQMKGPCARPGGSGDFFNPGLPPWEGYAHGTASATSIVDSIGRVIPNPSYLPPVASYSCLVDLDASYHPAKPDMNGCETWNFPGQTTTTAQASTPTTVPFVFCYAQIPVSAQIPQPNGSNLQYTTINESWWVLTSVTLPNSTQWKFGYDTYGQVNSVTLPTGGTVGYQYQTRIACGNPPGEIPVSGTPVWPFSNLMSSRMVSARKLTLLDGTAMTWTYKNLIGSGWRGGPPGTQQPNAVVSPGGANAGTVLVWEPPMNSTSQQNLTVHTFALQGGSACGPYETATQYYQGPNQAASALLKEVDTTYAYSGADFANPTNFSNYIAVGVFPSKKTTTLWTSSVSTTTEEDTTYDNTSSTAYGTYQDYEGLTHPFSFGQLQSSTEFDWGSPTGAKLRSTQHTKQWQSSYKYYAANLIDLPYQDTVFCSTCTSPSSQTTASYDEPSYSALPGLGNLTTVTHLLSGGTSPATHSVYTATGYGMPSIKIDPMGNPTKYFYDTTGLYLSQITYPNSSSAWFSYDPGTGLLQSSKDVNNQPTTYAYDAMRRLTYVTYPPNQGWEAYCFIDLAGQTCPGPGGSLSLTAPAFVFSKAISQTSTMYEAGLADGLGRLTQKQLLTDGPSGGPYVVDYTDTTYDGPGRVQSVTNPYRSTGSAATNGTTSYLYDALGRKTFQCQQDNGPASPVCVPANSYQQWSYSLNSTKFQDEVGNSWTHTSDALGRLTQVLEPNGVSNTTGAGAFETDYLYDALDNLTSVTQRGSAGSVSRNRSFTYDSLSRLLCASNPENSVNPCPASATAPIPSGVTSYTYDLDNNVHSKTDARGSTIIYAYDALNRLLSKTYPAGTASSCYQYDQSSLVATGGNLIGRMTNMWTQTAPCPAPTLPPAFQSASILSRRSILAYDEVGRIRSEQQCTRTNCNTSAPYAPAYTYDFSGEMLSHSSGLAAGAGAFTFTNGYDAGGHLTSVTSSNTQYPPGLFSVPTSVSASTCGQSGTSAQYGYSPAGGLMNATFGTSLLLSRTYDNRLRVSCETDTGKGLSYPTPSSATITILGTDQSH
jgi:YD repeat-containing protein